MKRDDKHGFYDEMLKALWGYMSDKFDIPTADLTKERIQEKLFECSIPEAQSMEYVRIISECEEAQYSPVSSSRMGELYREGVALVSELESASRNFSSTGRRPLPQAVKASREEDNAGGGFRAMRKIHKNAKR